MSTENELTLSDDAISGIARLLQVAILTGTDIIDNLRTLRLVNVDGNLRLSPEFVENFNDNIDRMLLEADNNADAIEGESSPFDTEE